MEEKETQTPKLPYEQLEKLAMQLQQSLMMAENQLRSIDFTSIRLKWLFKVLESENSFSAEFTNKCAKEIEELLTLEESTSNTEAENK